jgi:hypothetical protein
LFFSGQSLGAGAPSRRLTPVDLSNPAGGLGLGSTGPPYDGWFAGLIFDPQGKARFTVATYVRHGGLGGETPQPFPPAREIPHRETLKH